MNSLRIRNETLREFLAEFLGTFVLTCIGCSGQAYMNVAGEGAVSHVVGPWLWGMGLTAAIYISGGVSGGHANPAVTLGMASVGKLSWRKVFHYFLAQYLGAFLGAVITYVVYREAIFNKYNGELLTVGSNATAGIFGTFASEGISTGTAIIDQIVSVGFFLLLINAITDEKNMACPKGLVPIAIGVTDLGLVISAFGYNCGGPINPARDFSPRLFTAMAGWGPQVFSFNDYGYFWVPFIGCHIGGIVGCWVYKLFIENHWPNETYDLPNSNEK